MGPNRVSRRTARPAAANASDRLAARVGAIAPMLVPVAVERPLGDLAHKHGLAHIAATRLFDESHAKFRGQLDGQGTHEETVVRSAAVRTTDGDVT